MARTPEEIRQYDRERSRRRYLEHREEILAKTRARRAENKPVVSPEQRAQRNARARAKYAQKRPVLSPEQRARKAAAWRRWHAKNGAELNRRKRANRKRSATYVRNKRIRQQERQAGRPKPAVCEVCGDGRSRIQFDHCHQRGIFRGWICGNCNHALGCVNDDPDRLRKLIAYLERTRIIVPPQLTLPGI